jgi:ribosomal protein S18 acetylase RimI-like enzyme
MDGSTGLILRSIRPSDIPKVVEIHMQAFPGFFLSFLGPAFLSLLYQGILCDPGGVAIAAYADDQEIIGFVAGVTDQSGFYGRLISSRKWSFAKASLGALLARPLIAPRLIRALRRPKEAAGSSASACLMSIAVRPMGEGRGIGRLLVEQFCSQVACRGATAVILTTDRYDNDRVNSFYQRLGFHVLRSFVTPEGRGMNEYSRTL